MQGGFLYVQTPRSFSVYERTPLEKTKERSHQQNHFLSSHGKQAVKPPSTWEFMNFWGHKGLQQRFGKVDGERPKGLDG